MRHGFTEPLRQRLERHPQEARPILEVLTVDAEDIIDIEADWDAANSTSGFETLEEGGVRLTGSATVHAEAVTESAGSDITALVPPLSATIDCAVIEWAGSDVETIEIDNAVIRLDNDTGAGQEVTKWAAQMFRLHGAALSNALDDTVWRIVPISQVVYVTAGAAKANVTFTFKTGDTAPLVGPAPVTTFAAREAGAPIKPTTLLMVWALKGEGVAASNASWICDTGNTNITDNGHVVSRHQITAVSDQQLDTGGTLYKDEGQAAGVPYFSLKGNTYSETTMTFTTADIDLGAAPGSGDLELVVEGNTPGSTTFIVQIDDGVQGWTTVSDGDVIGADNSADPATSPHDQYANNGTNLSAFVRQQNYDIRTTLTPSTATTETPTVRRMGVREVTSERVDGLVTFGGTTWAVDPLTMQSEIPELEVSLLRNGNRDYRSFVEDLFSTYHVGQLHLRIWIGHPDLPRQDWLHRADFVIDDYEAAGPDVKLFCVSPLALSNRDIPVIAASTLQPLTYTTSTLKATYDDLMSGQIGVAARYIGPGVEDASTTVTKTISTTRKGLTELNRIAWIAGGSVIESQGRFKWVDFFTRKSPIAFFPMEEVKMLGVTPGLRTRVTGYKVAHGWDQTKDEGKGAYAGTKSVTHSAGITKLGRALVDITEGAEDEVSKYIEDATVAGTLADRTVAALGNGMMLWRFRSNIPHPWLEPGDPIAVESDRFVGRDPNTDNAIRGPVAALARIQACHDLEGREFTVWVQAYSDILGTSETVTHDGYESDALLTGAEIGFEDDGFVQLTWMGNRAFSKGYGRITTANTPSDPTNPTSSSKDFTLTGQHGSLKLEAAHADVAADHKAQIGQMVWVEIIAENGDGDVTQDGGSDRLWTVKRRRGDSEFIPPTFHVTATRSGTTITITIAGKDLSESMTAFDHTYSYPDGAGGTTTASASTSWTSGTWSAGTRVFTVTKNLTVSAGVTGQFSFDATYNDALGATRHKGITIALENIDTVAKTLTIAAPEFMPASEAESWTHSGASIYPGTAANNLDIFGPVVLPPGANITSFQTNGVRRNAGDTCVATLKYGTYSGGTPPSSVGVTIATNTHSASASAWSAVTTTGLAHTVATGVGYFVDTDLTSASGTSDAGFGWAKILYDADSYDVTI